MPQIDATSHITIARIRWLLAIQSSVYALWYFVVEIVLPGYFNPGLSRMVIVAIPALVLLLTFLSDFGIKHARSGVIFCSWAMTSHYFYLYWSNNADLNWVVGAYITVLCLGLTIDSTWGLGLYSLFVLGTMTFIGTKIPSSVVVVPGMATILFLQNVALYLRRREEAERLLRQQLELDLIAQAESNKTKMIFLANVSHELRTPLTAIVGYSDLIKENHIEDNLRADYLNRIESNAQALLSIVNQLLALTEEDVKKSELAPKTVEIRKFFANIINSVRPSATNKGLNIVTNFGANIPETAVFDPHPFTTMMLAVLGNAVKFTSVGLITIDITFMKTAESAQLNIFVKDTGIGIEKKLWNNIFESFTQAESQYNRPFGGPGIGLSVARRLAQSMGGDVKIIASEPGTGSAFKISVPVQ